MICGQMVAEGPAEALTQTVNTQPVMLTAGIAAWRLWSEKGGKMPAVVAGHSLGEYSALVAAGVIEFKDAVPLVRSARCCHAGSRAAWYGCDGCRARAWIMPASLPPVPKRRRARLSNRSISMPMARP